MTQQEQINNQLREDQITPIEENNSLENQGNEIVYIAELNGEFYTVDYNNEGNNPTVTPLKIVEFMNSTEQVTEDSQLVSVANSTEGEIKPLTEGSLATPIPSQSTKPKLSTRKSVALGVGIGLLIAWGGAKILSNQSTSSPVAGETTELAASQARSVTVGMVKESLVDRNLEVSGTVAALELVPVISEVAGLQIQEILVDEGAKVTKDQVLAKLNNDTLEAEYLQAQATVDGAKARLAELKAGTRSEEIAQAQERVNSAIASVEQAKSDLDLVTKRVERNRNLEAEGAISRDRLDEINNQERIARANLERAEANLQEANQQLKQFKAGARPEEIAQAEAELAQAEAKLQYAKVQLDNTEIKAVTDGIIAERNAKIGDVTSASQKLFTIIEKGNLELRLQVPETDLSRIQPGQKVTIANNQNNEQPMIGKVREIDPIVDSDSRQAVVKVNLPEGTNLQPGMFLEAAITTSRNQGLTVPIKALLPQIDDNAIAYILKEDNTVEARQVKMGEILSNNRIEVLSGLENGEKIVVKGATYLKDGDKVSVENNK